MEFSEEQEYCFSAFRIVDPTGTTKISAGFSLSGGIGSIIGLGGSSSFSIQIAWGEGKPITTGVNMTNSAGSTRGGDLSLGFRVSVSGDTEVKTGSSLVNQTGGSLGLGVGVGVDKTTSFKADGGKSEGIAFTVKTGTSDEVHSRVGLSETISTKDLLNKASEFFGFSGKDANANQTSNSSNNKNP